MPPVDVQVAHSAGHTAAGKDARPRSGIPLVDADEPPLRLVLGVDAIDTIRARLERLSAELAEWEEVGRGTAIRD